ncbi:hypothetical protein BT63DRAFT_187407 [Microthyrium microscopicum]|uniref:AAA+ ATPase domain-containing protein n=1 Tax=Microthyrium microscopicum TaxID=703497 RepID=A0A6A6UKM6_9PEZI|nr:hypothetical protein BT63DRAFT_187407 [Microthyrium microscopicum]
MSAMPTESKAFYVNHMSKAVEQKDAAEQDLVGESYSTMDMWRKDENPVVSDLREHVKRLESRLAGLENGHTRNDSLHETGYTDADDVTSGMHGDDTYQPKNMKYLPIVRKCNFTEFKNRFTKEDAACAVDVLESGPLFEQEFLEEQKLRDRLFEHGNKKDAKLQKQKASALVKETDRSSNALRNDQSGRTWIHRIRIQAPPLLKILARVQNETWSNRPRTYDRPFCTLMAFQPKVKEALAELEEKWSTQSEGHTADSPKSTLTAMTGVHEREAEQDSDDDDEDSLLLDDSQATLAILQAYTKFIDTEIITESQRFETVNCSTEEKDDHNVNVIFSDLCYLFKPGDYIYRPVQGDQAGQGCDYRMGERLWRVYFVNDAIRNYNFLPPDHRRYSNEEPSEDDSTQFTVHAYHIEYTGEEFCVVSNTFRISPFEKFKPINSLPIYPIRFLPGHEEYMDNAEKIGDLVLDSIETKHALYNAWTVMRTPKGGYVTDAEGAMIKHPEYINSEIMVDFGEAFQACPSWRPKRSVLKTEFTNKINIVDDFRIRWWSGKDRQKLIRETQEIIPYRTGVHHLKRNQFVLEDPFLVAVSQNHHRGLPTTKKYLRREEKMLIHNRVFAYVFRERKFAQLDVTKSTSSARKYDALEALKIPQDVKGLIQGSVRGHFMLKESEGVNGEERMSLDVIQGKGTGLFILLHGVPGVGKTATAEAIAQANGKPLFKITCGDIGLTPEQVETNLRAIFRLASIWDCILLLDEVDTFFSQRSRGDSSITKNALVSVFLRVLDYYTGILFLTTNRPGALDEAFKSRIHAQIYYPPLSKRQTLDIWQLNIKRLRQIGVQIKDSKEQRPLLIPEEAILSFADIQFEKGKLRKAGAWNGRQIRNAFQMARSLAYFDASKDDPSAPASLDIRYFEMMHEITESFDRYMLEVYSGQSAGTLALEMEDRADHFTQRTVRLRETDGDEHYHSYSGGGTGSPFAGLGGRQDHGDRKQSANYMGRASVGGGRYGIGSFGPSVTAGYDDQVVGEKSPALAQMGEGPPGEFKTGSPFEVEHSGARRSSSFGRNGGYGMGRERHFEGESNYRMERNDYGKRERT